MMTVMITVDDLQFAADAAVWDCVCHAPDYQTTLSAQAPVTSATRTTIEKQTHVRIINQTD